MSGRLESRLVKLEQRRRQQADDDDPNRPPDFAELCGYPRGTLLSTMLRLEEERMAREIAAGTYVKPEPPDPTIWPTNVINVDSEFCKITGDLEGWRENEMKIKRWSPEWERQNWPEIDAEPAPGKDAYDDQESNSQT
jgi:hypothetical protein